MEKLLNVHEIAELLGVQSATVYQWTHEGFIPFIKLGKFVRFQEKVVLKWLEQKSTPGRKTRKFDLKELHLDFKAKKKYSGLS